MDTGTEQKHWKLAADADRCENDEFGVIETVAYKILGIGDQQMGHLVTFRVTEDAVLHEEATYYDILDAHNESLSRFAYRCTEDSGFFRLDVAGSPPPDFHQLWELDDSNTFVFIDQLVIYEAYRRKGVGSWAIQQLQKTVSLASILITEESTLNTPEGRGFDQENLVKFYHKLGFRRLGDTEFFALARDGDHISKNIPSTIKEGSYKKPAPYAELNSEEEKQRFILTYGLHRAFLPDGGSTTITSPLGMQIGISW